MSSNTKVYEEKMKSAWSTWARAGRACRPCKPRCAGQGDRGLLRRAHPHPAGGIRGCQRGPHPDHHPWDRTLLRAISKAIMASDVGINPIDDGQTIRLNFPAPTEERRKQLAKEVSKLGEEAKVAVRNIRRDAMDKAKVMKKSVS